MSVLVVAVAFAASISPSGHWEGTVDTPQASIAIQVDIEESGGVLAGAMSVPSQHLQGLPLTKIAIDGATLTFSARSDQPMEARLSEDGKSMAGTFSMPPYAFPFTLTRTGRAQIAPQPASPRVGPDLEGAWIGTLGDRNANMRLVLTIRNDTDGMARGDIVNLDEGGLRIPVAIAQQGATVTLESPVVAGSFTGSIDPNGALVGAYRQDGAELPLTFTRASARDPGGR